MRGLPDYVFEWIGRTVAERLDLLVAEYRTEISELKAANAELKAGNLELVSQLKEKWDAALLDVDRRLSEIKDGKDGIDGKDGRDGIDGKDGAPGEKGAPGDKGEKGDPGADGVVRIHKSNWEGIWEEGKEYEAGCLVSHAGSGWHCNLDGTKERPGEGSKDWTLAIKRGRDGKPGLNGKDGAPGPQGPKGQKGDRGYNA